MGNDKENQRRPQAQWLFGLFAAILLCAFTGRSGAAPVAEQGASAQTESAEKATDKDKGPRYDIYKLTDTDLWYYYRQVAETDPDILHLYSLVTSLPENGSLFSLYRTAAGRGKLYSFGTQAGDAVAINNHGEILFKSGTIYKWTGKGIEFERRTAGPLVPAGSPPVPEAWQRYDSPEATGINDAGEVVGDSNYGLYLCAPGGSAALLASVPSAEDVGSENNGEGPDAPALLALLNAAKAQGRFQGAPQGRNGAGSRPSGQGFPRGAIQGYEMSPSTSADPDLASVSSALAHSQERAALKLLPRGPCRLIVPTLPDGFLAEYPDFKFPDNPSLISYNRINNKGQVIGRTRTLSSYNQTGGYDQNGGQLSINAQFEDTPLLFWQSGRAMPLETAFPSLLGPKSNSSKAETRLGNVSPSANAGQSAFFSLPWGNSLTHEAYSFEARDINDKGHLIGVLSKPSAPQDPKTGLWPENGALWDGQMKVLRGPANCLMTYAHGLNNRDQIVGACLVRAVKDQAGQRATLWQDGKVYDLNACIPVNSGWSLSSACAINDKGEIVGGGLYQGEAFSYLLIPVSESLPAATAPASVPVAP